MKNILAFAGSNSSKSINHQLLQHVVDTIDNKETNVELFRLTDFEIPMYSIDVETNDSIPKDVTRLNTKIKEADGLIISVAEHNGNITAFFKSTMDWLSRNNREFILDKKILLLSTSPGERGALSALEITTNMLSRMKANVASTQNIGNFFEHFKEGKIEDATLNSNIEKFLETL